MKRDTSRDGLRNKIENFLLTRGRPIWKLVNNHPAISRVANRLIVDNAVSKAPYRPLRLSTLNDYPSWASLTDRTWFSRYLPPKDIADLPPIDVMAQLYRPRDSGPRLSDRSTLLFPVFAQWFTDGFLMTSAADSRRTTTSHQIELCQLYGLDTDVQRSLRLLSEEPGRRGRLLSETDAQNEEWAPRLFRADGTRDPRFECVPTPMKMPPTLEPERKATIFAFGGERANSTAYTAAVNTLFLREHNRLCGVIEKANSAWDDERVFQTARNVNIVQLIKIVVGEYINHISPYWFKLLGDPSPCYTAGWNRTNWIPVEFNLLYRWHSMVPMTAKWNGAAISVADTRFGNSLLLADGLGAALDSASRSLAWRIGLFNTAEMLQQVELASVQQGRTNRLASYNDYRERMKYPRVTRFEQISSDPQVIDSLKRLYGTVDRIEFFVGIFAEDLPARSAVPPLLGRMVALDAFSHALTNPLLSPNVFTRDTFSAAGWDCIAATSTLRDLARRNLPNGGEALRISMEHPSYAAVA